MRGAAYLCGLYDDGGNSSPTAIVCDVGGTTSDFGILLPSGYPRRAAGDASIAGVRVNYHMPQVESIGIGGGSIVREIDGKVTVGRDSVGCAILERALVFGGDTMTATDVAVARGSDQAIGNSTLVEHIAPDTVTKVQMFVKREWERVCDRMKMSPELLPLIIVGGGSMISPPALDGISTIIKPLHHHVANAVGAAIARVGATVDTIQHIGQQTAAHAVEKATAMARDRVIANGALPETVEITEQETLPLQYVDGKVRIIVRAVGDFPPSEIRIGEWDIETEEQAAQAQVQDERGLSAKPARESEHDSEHSVDVDKYRPRIITDERTGFKTWIVSPTDLEWLAEGCYVLGCGGGGSPYPEMFKLNQHIERGHELRIIDLASLRPESRIYCKLYPLNTWFKVLMSPI
jgi:N-methylhydantoinase A/oxoprolinase/acetone carboxylase beta subunit